MSAFIPSNSWMNFCEYYQYEGVEFFDSPEFPEFPQSTSDRIVEIDFKYAGRIDLLAHDYLGSVDYWWIIAILNDLRVLPSELSIGKKIRIPIQENITKYLKKAQK